ncbi:MAG: hypothetical protein GX372_03950 [Ignavibacteria bacterium]|nr:hypothetical protein [Ignavibacteria bacterium]
MPIPISGGARIRTNIPAQNAYNSLSEASNIIARSQLRLSTGKRINSASDDVAGYITSKSLTARTGALQAALQAAGDAKNVTGIAQDALDQIGALLTQIKDATAQASSGALGSDEKVALAKSSYRLAQQIQFITDSTVFGGKQLLQGNFSGDWVTGYYANDELMTVKIDLTTNNLEEFNIVNVPGSPDSTTVGLFDLNATKDAKAIRQAVTYTAGPDETRNTGVDEDGNLTTETINRQIVNLEETKLMTGAATSFAGVAGLNLEDFNEVAANDLGIFTNDGNGGSGTGVHLTLQSLSRAINNINKVASYLGGIHTRLSSQEEVLKSQTTNYKAAISRIEDTDIAEEQMRLITAQFLQSASLTSLAQSNQNPATFLQLLQ